MEKWDGENGKNFFLREMEVHGIGCRTEVEDVKGELEGQSG